MLPVLRDTQNPSAIALPITQRVVPPAEALVAGADRSAHQQLEGYWGFRLFIATWFPKVLNESGGSRSAARGTRARSP